MKKCLLTLISLISLSHSLVYCVDRKEVNWKNVSLCGAGITATVAIIYYAFGDKVKNYVYGPQATTSDITYEPSLQEALSNSAHNSSQNEQSEITKQSQPTTIELQKSEHKANQELSTALQTTQQRAEVIGRKIIYTAQQCGGDFWEKLKRTSATEYFTDHQLD